VHLNLRLDPPLRFLARLHPIAKTLIDGRFYIYIILQLIKTCHMQVSKFINNFISPIWSQKVAPIIIAIVHNKSLDTWNMAYLKISVIEFLLMNIQLIYHCDIVAHSVIATTVVTIFLSMFFTEHKTINQNVSCRTRFCRCTGVDEFDRHFCKCTGGMEFE